MPSTASLFGNELGNLLSGALKEIGARQEKKSHERTLRSKFPDHISDHIMELPTEDRKHIMRQLAQEESDVEELPMAQEESLMSQLRGSPMAKGPAIKTPPPIKKPPVKAELPFSRVSDRKLVIPGKGEFEQVKVANEPLKKVPTEASRIKQVAQKAHLGKDLRKEDYKQAYDYAEDVTGIGRASKQGLVEAKRMEKLNNSGRISPALWSSAIKLIGAGGYGPDLTSLLSPESVEFDKIATGFLKNAKNYFGSRMTEGEVNLFLRTVPSLMQSKKGRDRLIQNMKNMFEAGNIRSKAFNAIKEELGGKTPANIEQLVEEATAPQIDSLHARFINGIPSKENQQKYQEGKVYVNKSGDRAIGVNRDGTIVLEKI